MQQITEYVGSGPFIFQHQGRGRSRARLYAIDRQPEICAAPEPASEMAGGKVAKLDRMIWDNVADDQTAIAACRTARSTSTNFRRIDLKSISSRRIKNIHVEEY